MHQGRDRIMSNTTNDTIEDLSPIPYFPYQPGWLEWSILLLFVFAISALAFYITRRPRTKIKQAIEFCLKELNYIEDMLKLPDTSKDQVAEYLSKASILVKRLLSNTEDTNIASLTLKELKELQANLKSESLRTLIDSLCDVEDTRFHPKIEQSNSSNLIHNLRNSLIEYKEVALLR